MNKFHDGKKIFFSKYCALSFGEGNDTPLQYSCPGKSHGWKSLVGYSPWGRKELDMTEWLHFHFSLSWTGEGNGNPPQCSCLENPRDGGAWWAAVYGVVQSWTRLKRLSQQKQLFPSSKCPICTQCIQCGKEKPISLMV